MYLDFAWLIGWGIATLGFAWSSVARGRTINCMMGCYRDLLHTTFDELTLAMLDVEDGKPPGQAADELRSKINARLPLHKKALAQTGETFPPVGSLESFRRELLR